MCKSSLFIRNKAKPPLWCLLGTMNMLSNLRWHLTFSRQLFFFLVSIKNNNLGPFALTKSESFRTRRGNPSPRQFQLKQFIGSGGADAQPPLIVLLVRGLHEDLQLSFSVVAFHYHHGKGGISSELGY